MAAVDKSNPGKLIAKLAAEFVKHQAKKHLGERLLVTAAGEVTQFLGKRSTRN